MARTLRWSVASLVIVALTLVGSNQAQILPGDKGKPVWTSEEIMQLLAHQPNDPYLQYVAVQLARREGTLDQHRWQFDAMFRRAQFDPGRRERADMFNTFTGALAVQESLQLDTLVGDDDRVQFEPQMPIKGTVDVPADQPIEKADKTHPAPKPAEPKPDPKGPRPKLRDIARALKARNVAIDTLQAPTVKSHPWETMLAGKKPDIGSLAKCVPDDFYFVEFKSTTALMQALSVADVWGDHIFTQMMGQANSQDTEKRIKKQLGIAGIPTAVIDAMGVEGVAVTGSDLYLADGSDITLLVQGKQVVAMRQWADSALQKAGVQREAGSHLDYKYSRSFTPDGETNVYTADPRPDLHVRSNSLPAFRRVLEAIAGKDADGKTVARLGDTAEFAFIRTILPRGSAEEDGIIYLSDPCIRRLVGPLVKLGQRRRLITFNHLKMIEHAALMFRTENGRAPKSFDELAQSGCAPGVFGKDKLACPAGGTYTLTDDHMSAVSSVYGRPGRFTPLLEVPIKHVTDQEAAAYKAFVNDYNQYWRTYFDPIAVRIKVTPQQYRLETVILPLIDNSIYTGMAMALGGKPAALDSAALSKKSIFTVAAKLNKQPALDMLPPDSVEAKDSKPDDKGQGVAQSADRLKQIILALYNLHDVQGHFPSAAIRSKDGKPLLSSRVAVLPYLEEAAVYQQFKLDEPWDSENNKKLIATMPAVFAGRNAKITAEHKTPFVVPIGKDTIFPPDGKRIGLADIADGTSNTIACVETTDDRAVIWTKPDDWEVNFIAPLIGLTSAERDSFLIALADGSVRHVRGTVPADVVKGMLTRAGAEPVDLPNEYVINLPGERRPRLGPLDWAESVNVAKLRRFLRDGIGDQVAMHIYDAAQPIGAQVSSVFAGGGALADVGMRMGLYESAAFAFFAQALLNPVCVSIPIKDAKVVDDFLAELDKIYNERIAHEFRQFFRPEYYTMAIRGQTIRCIALKFIGMNLRICWGRFGNQLCIVNHPSVFDDLPDRPTPTTNDSVAHAMIRVRPENWKAVLPVYQLGWEEGNRAACQANVMRISNVARGWADLAKPGTEAQPALLDRVTQLYGVRPFCPDAGHYMLSEKCSCSLHGGWNNPRQPTAPNENSATAKSVRAFAGMTATLTFLEDGLHAVVTIDRK